MRVGWMTMASVLLLGQVAMADIREAPPAEPVPESMKAAEKQECYWRDLGYGSLAVVTNVFYMPVKIAYALVGLPVGGLGYVLTAGDSDISDAIWGQSLGGDYVLTPKMLLGEQEVHFNGRSGE